MSGTKPAAMALLHREAEQAHLEPGPDALEEVEPGAGDLGTALHVDRVEGLGEREVVARLEALGGEVARLRRRSRRRRSRPRRRSAPRARRRCRSCAAGRRARPAPRRRSACSDLTSAAIVLGARQQGLLLLALRPGDVLAHRLLLGPQPLVGGEGAAAALVGGPDGVDDPLVLTPGALAGADEVGVVAEQLDVDHPGVYRRGRGSRQAGRAAPRHPADHLRCEVQRHVGGGAVQDLTAGRAAVVTGGARGIGLAVVEAIAAQGVAVLCLDQPDADYGRLRRRCAAPPGCRRTTSASTCATRGR